MITKNYLGLFVIIALLTLSIVPGNLNIAAAAEPPKHHAIYIHSINDLPNSTAYNVSRIYGGLDYKMNIPVHAGDTIDIILPSDENNLTLFSEQDLSVNNIYKNGSIVPFQELYPVHLTSKTTFMMNIKEYVVCHYVVTDRIYSHDRAIGLPFYYKKDSKDRYRGWETKLQIDYVFE